MKIYDLTITIHGGEIMWNTYYSAKSALKGLQQVKANGFKVKNYHITDREATQKEMDIYNNHQKLIREMDEMF